MEYLTCDNFNKIKNFILEEGEHILWSSRYSDGFQYEFRNIDVIYVPSEKGELPAGSWDEFFYIKVRDVRLDYDIENDGNKITIDNHSQHYYGKKMRKIIDANREEADLVFSEILKHMK
ncbi:MAG TPA: hypothetical protein ENJ08_03455 [Gammaproteobacteria bacterium]|nr:hypothetical protein [Gammaproteobacteria bacterium]